MSTTESQTASPPCKRRWLQFSLRTLLLFMLLASIGLSWVAVKMEQARKEREAVEAIRKTGGSVGYDYEFSPSGNRVVNGKPRTPAWLRRVLGEDFFDSVVAATVNNDAALEHLKRFKQLRDVNLYGHQITDSGIEHLEALTQLRNVYLYEIAITDAGLEHLKGLTQLEELYLNGTRITDGGLEHLDGMRQLQTLVLDDTQVTDAGLEHIHGLTRLERLFLVGTKVTDAGLRHLQGLHQLRELWVGQTQVTDEGIKKLQQALPNCKIAR